MTIESPDATNVADAGTGPISVENNAPSAGAEKVSMDDTIRNAYRSQQTREPGVADDNVQPSQGRVRGPDGKFVRANGAAQPNSVNAEPNSATEMPESDSAVTPEPVAPKPHDAAPNTWRKELATEFGKLPESVRQEIHRREADFHKGIGQYKQAATFAQSMARELLPYEQTMQQYNKQPNEVVKEATAAWNLLLTADKETKATFWLQVAKDYGIDISQLGTAPQQAAAGQTQDDPRLATALQRLEKLESHLTTQERQRAEAEFSTHVESVKSFGSDPKHRHFEAVREDMAVLIESGRAKDLQDAYDKAVWINPDVRASLLADQEKERATKLAADAAKARQAAGANVTRRGTPPVPQKPGTMEDTIRSSYRRIQSGS
jgi:hypothetical protein